MRTARFVQWSNLLKFKDSLLGKVMLCKNYVTRKQAGQPEGVEPLLLPSRTSWLSSQWVRALRLDLRSISFFIGKLPDLSAFKNYPGSPRWQCFFPRGFGCGEEAAVFSLTGAAGLV
jgi:hypothetical protein